MTAQPFRLASGGRIDRGRPIAFSFDGRLYGGFAGDTVASALLANGVRLVGRSFKYHRPRGILSHGVEEPNALLSVSRGRGRTDPNNRATVVEATDGLITRSQNRWPSLTWDFGAVNDALAPVFAAGFYYKTFMWPQTFWRRVYEPAIRAAAGLGVAPRRPDPDRYLHRYAYCDVLVVGGGPAGLSAALAAARDGRRVILADEQAELGGALLHDRDSLIDGEPAETWRLAAVAELSSRPNVTLLSRTTAFGYYNHNHLALLERVADHFGGTNTKSPRERLWQVRAGEVLLAAGAHERPLIFEHNDLPGVMLAESVRAYLNRYAVAPGRRIVFATSGASAYSAAMDALTAGVESTIVDLRGEEACGPELAAFRALGGRALTGCSIVRALGRKAVKGVVIENGGVRQVLDCDCLAMSGGWTPAVHLFSQSRGKLARREDIDAFVPGVATQAVRTVGAANGTYDLGLCLGEGWNHGARSVESRDFRVRPSTSTGFARAPAAAPRRRRKTRAFVDFQNDVTADDVRLAVREGFQSIEHVKRYTTTGMATDQGKTSNMGTLGIVAEALEKPVAQVGVTTFRPPYTPVTFGAIAGAARGELFDPIRRAPLHDWAAERGAVFEPVGLWRRARYFPRPGEDMRAAVARECRTVRSSAGIFDASTLGKIEVVGPDAAEFMNRIYVNGWLKLEPGRCRYGLMLKEDGYIFDDGVVARMSDDRFHVTTTTGGAPRVLIHMEDYLQTEWPNLRVYLTSTTEQWAVIAVQGPSAREIIAPLVSGVDVSPEAFPHMSVRTGLICGAPMRLFRVSFTGELGFEINVPTDYAEAVWSALWEKGRAFGMTAYGTETMHVLRAERGFIMVGQETDGTVTPDDLGLGKMVKAKGDFVGRRSLERPDLIASGRKQLVGLLTEAAELVLDEGAQVVADPGQPIPMRALGHVTSSYWSETCGRSIAMALVAGGRARVGEVLHATTSSGFARVRVVEPVFFDPGGERVNG